LTVASVWRALAALFVLFAPAAARADERILRYLSDVQVRKDSSLLVNETIDVRAEHQQINHGIYRDFPTRYRGPRGSQVRVGFSFEGATLDGMPVPAKVEPFGNGVRIKVGDPDRTVDIGEHVYVLRYRTTRQVGHFKDFDEVYWNATGNGWVFPIDVAEARIRLPEAAKFGQRSMYTGPQGSTASDARVVDEKPGDILFSTTRPLGAYEGLTVAVAFPKGVIAKATRSGRIANWLADNGPPLVGLLSLIGLAGFYFVAWQRAGRDPRAGTIVPIFSPPERFTPAGMRYLMKMGSDNRVFAAALVDMGVRGHVRLVEQEGGWFSRDKTLLERHAGTNPLPPEEQAALEKLCPTGESIMMEQKNHAKFSAAKKALDDVLKTQYEGKLFNKNWGWAVAGLFLFLFAIWLVSAAVVAASGLDATRVLVPLGAAVAAALLFLWIQAASAIGKCLISLVGFAFAALAIGTGAPILFEALQSGWLFVFGLPLLALPLMISAFFWIDAPTLDGRKVLDQIAGFKQYLSITERERLDRMTAPNDTPDIFEKYLPYAIALGVENRWAERFAGVLAAAAASGRQGFAWYSGSSNPWDNPSGFVDTVGSSLSSTISSASTAPGSSSGSGGGGSSGGGGGGGGGGGW
jgi:uncharacterized membrane protein YgcG